MKSRNHLTGPISICLVYLLTLALSSCGAIKPATPEIIIEKPNIPSQPISIIKIPIKLNLAPYFAEANKSIPRKFSGKEDVCEGVSYSYKFNRDPIKFNGIGNQLLFDVEGKYSLNLNYCPQCTGFYGSSGSCVIPRVYASCGVDEPMRKIHLAYATKIKFSADYQLISETSLKKVETLSPCLITVFSYNATQTLKEELKIALKDVAVDIDKEISSIDLKPEIEATWKLLSEQTKLDGYGFFDIHPSAISMSPIKFKGDTAYFSAILEATPSICTESRSQTVMNLPNLSEYTNRNGFDITMDVVASYDSLSAILTRKIKGTKIEISGKEVIFGEIAIHGASNERINLKVEFGGKKKGVLYLTGTPAFDSIRQHISFPDLTFDVKTKSALLKSAKWLFDKKITETIRRMAAMDLKPYLDSLKSTLNTSINTELTKGVYMKGSIRSATINFIHPSEKEFFMRIRSFGKLEISL